MDNCDARSTNLQKGGLLVQNASRLTPNERNMELALRTQEQERLGEPGSSDPKQEEDGKNASDGLSIPGRPIL